MGFNPILAANELAPADALHPANADVATAQDDMASDISSHACVHGAIHPAS
jgi:hypothetical protein